MRLTQFTHRVAVFLTPFVAAGFFAAEQGIRNGTLSSGDIKGIVLAFVSGAGIAVLNYLRGKAAPTPPAVKP